MAKKNIYLLKGDSYRLLNEEIANITSTCESKETFSLLDISLFDILEDASYAGLFASKRALIIKDVKYFGGKFLYEDESKALLSFAEKMDDDITLIFICDDIKASKTLTKKLLDMGATSIDVTISDAKAMSEKLTHYVQTQAGKIDASASALLIKYSNNNIDIAYSEVDKLLQVSSVITEELIKNYCTSQALDSTFDFSNAVVAKDFSQAFTLLDRLMQNGVDGYTLVGILASSFANMYMVKAANQDGLDDDTIAKMFGYSSTGRVYVLKKNGKIYTLEQLADIIVNLADLDIKIKTGLNPIYGLKEFLLNL